MITVAVAGTTHPLGVAGLTLDLRAGARLGARVVAIVAGVTAQDAGGVRARSAVDPATIAAQFAAVHTAEPAALHVGALLEAASVHAVAAGIAALDVPVVVDPVLAASAGRGATAALGDGDTAAAIAHALLPLATVITPNRAEACALLAALGEPADGDAATLAERLVARGVAAALVTGGDDPGPDAVDVLARRDGPTVELRASRIAATLRGTGDLLALAIAVGLGRGEPLDDAVAAARSFVRACLREGEPIAGTRALNWTPP